MGNSYRIMKEITLSCHLFRDIEAGSENFEIKILTSDISFRLHDKIMQHLKEKHNTMFSDIKSSNLELWKVNISNDNEEKFSKLVLKNDDNEGIQNIWGMISDYWEEQPSNGFTHVIIDSPYLTTLRKLKALTTGDSGENEENYDRDINNIENIDKSNRSQKDDNKTEVSQSADKRDSFVFITDKRSGCHIHEMIDAGIIILGDELRIDKKYRGIQVNIGCKIAKLTSSIRISSLSVVLIDNENEQTEISDWKALEKWLLTKYKDLANVDLNIDQIILKKSTENIKLVRDGKTLGSIRSLVKINNENIE